MKTPKSLLSPSTLSALTTAIALLGSQSASADTLYWDVNGTTAGYSTVVGAWNGTNAFWNTDATGGGGTVQAGTTSADDLIISQATTNTGNITVTGARLASSITFAANVGPTTNITGGSGSITIGGSGASSGIFQQSSGANTVSTALTLNSANTAFNFSSTGAGTLTISGAVTGSASTGNTQTINVGSSAGNVLITGAISDGANGGKVAVVYDVSGGSTTLSASNTFSGGFTLNNGTVVVPVVTTYNGFGTGLLTLNGGAMRTSNTTSAINIDNDVAWNGIIGFGRSGGGYPIFTFNGNITLDGAVGTAAIGAAEPYSMTFNGNIGEATLGSSFTFGTNSNGHVFTFNGQNTFTGGINTSGKALVIGGSGYLGGGNYSGTIASGGFTYSSSANQTLGGVISGSTLTKDTSTSSTLTLTATNTYSGATTVNAGTLAVNGTGSINNSAVTINGGTFRYNSSVAYNKTLTFTSGTIGGTNLTGSLGGLTIGANQTLSPGNSPGTAVTTSQTWATGGSYVWEVNNATGTAGADPGWDLLSGTGTLNITAASGSEFNLLLTSLDISNAAGLATNFNDALSYNWLIADFNSVTNFAVDAFTINTSAFTNPFTGTFNVALGDTGGIGGTANQIYLTYTAIPEPGAALLSSLGILLLLRRRRCS